MDSKFNPSDQSMLCGTAAGGAWALPSESGAQCPGKGPGALFLLPVHERDVIAQVPLRQHSGVGHAGVLTVPADPFLKQVGPLFGAVAAGGEDCLLYTSRCV